MPEWQPGDKFQCWLVLHAAHCFRVPTEQERAEQLAYLDKSKKVNKDRRDGRAAEAPSHPKKQKSMKDFFMRSARTLTAFDW